MTLIGKTLCSRSRPGSERLPLMLLAVLGALLTVGCRQDMHDQPKIEPYEVNNFFADGMGSRIPPAGTIARGWLREDSALWEGKDAAGELVDTLPMALDQALLERGQQRFEIYCSVCHGSTGDGQGMIVRRGFKQPSPLYEQRLQEMPVGYFFDVMTNGFGLMSSYAKQVPVQDRWAIAAYIRALQLSQNAALAELPSPIQDEFHAALTAAESEGDGVHHDDAAAEHH